MQLLVLELEKPGVRGKAKELVASEILKNFRKYVIPKMKS
jgi:hypothetical protein